MPTPREWAADLLVRSDWLILDTETTGLNDDAEMVQLGVLSPTGAVLLDSLIRPRQPIPSDATAIHGITDTMVSASPTFAEVFPELADIVRDGLVVSYNAPFDCRMIVQSLLGSEPIDLDSWRYINADDVQRRWQWTCAMQVYAEYVGEWSRRHGNYRYQRLPRAEGETGHSAIGDCRSVLTLIRQMAEGAR